MTVPDVPDSDPTTEDATPTTTAPTTTTRRAHTRTTPVTTPARTAAAKCLRAVRGTRGRFRSRPVRRRDGQVLPRPDGLRQVDAGAAVALQPLPAGPARAAADQAGPIRAGPDQLPDRDQPARPSRSPTSRTSASWSGRPGRSGRRVDYLIVDEAQFFTADQIDQLARAGRRRAGRRLRLRHRHRLPRPAVPRLGAAVRAGRRGRAAAGRGALLVRADRPVQRPGGRTDGSSGRAQQSSSPTPQAALATVESVRYQVLCRDTSPVGNLWARIEPVDLTQVNPTLAF